MPELYRRPGGGVKKSSEQRRKRCLHGSALSLRGDAESGFLGNQERLGVEVKVKSFGHGMVMVLDEVEPDVVGRGLEGNETPVLIVGRGEARPGSLLQ